VSGIELVPESIRHLYEVREWCNAVAVLAGAHPQVWADILSILDAFRFQKSQITQGGGNESPVARSLKARFRGHGWTEKQFDITVRIEEYEMSRRKRGAKTNEHEYKTPTHEVDYFKNRVAFEME
jgi:hypothetical protein